LPVVDLGALPAGTPAQWLARRPDLIAAERQLAAANADIGVSRAELYPHISLSGLLGLSSATLDTLTHSDSLRYAIGPTLSWNAFDFGRVRGRIAGSEARAQQALASWQQSVRLALEETEGAFSAFGNGRQRSEQLAVAAQHADAAAGLARMRYEAGVTDFLAVLDAERDALTTRDQLTQARTDTASALVAVYRTLGGGWEAAPPE
ncbi:MAG: TolC family protein, partial [Pseudomonadota bacterium]|nr:TolC family protein [Pseudomonadota bacterium]